LSMVVLSPTGERITIPNPQFGDQIEFPDLVKDSFVSADDVAALKAKRDQLATVATRYKKAAGAITPMVTAIDAALEQLILGRVLVSGTWMNRNEYDQKMREATGPKGASVASVPFKGAFLKNVRVSAVRGDRVSLVHDAGIATIPLSEIPADVLAQLKATAPQLFLAKAAATSPPAASPSTSVVGTPAMTPSVHANPSESFSSAIKEFKAETIPSREVTEGSLGRGKIYAFKCFAIQITSEGIAGSFDKETPHFALFPSRNHDFSSMAPLALGDGAIPFAVIARLEEVTVTDVGKLPNFTCLYIEDTSGREIYRAALQNQKLAPSLNATKDECERWMGRAPIDITTNIIRGRGNTKSMPTFDAVHLYGSAKYAAQVFFKENKSFWVMLTKPKGSSFTLAEATGVLRDALNETKFTKPQQVDGKWLWTTEDQKVVASIGNNRNGESVLSFFLAGRALDENRP